VVSRSKPYSLSPDLIHFVAPDDGYLDFLVALNREAFEGSRFQMTVKELSARNTGFIDKHPKVFMLIRNPSTEMEQAGDGYRFVGYTCVLPLNEVGADRYLNGLLRDREVRASLLCGPREPCNHILLFSIALGSQYSRKPSGVILFPFLLRCAEYHIQTIAQFHDDSGRITVWAHSEFRTLQKLLEKRGFTRDPQRHSADGLGLYSRKLEVTTTSKR